MAIDVIPTLVTGRLTLTPLTADDAPGMLAVYADPRMYEFTGGAPPDAAQLRARFATLAAGWNGDRTERWCNWIVRAGGCGEPIGAMQATIAHDLSWAAVAWEIGVRHQGRGFASEAAVTLVDWLVAVGVSYITAAIHPGHAASAGVATRAGLTSTTLRDGEEVVWQRVAGPLDR